MRPALIEPTFLILTKQCGLKQSIEIFLVDPDVSQTDHIKVVLHSSEAT